MYKNRPRNADLLAFLVALSRGDHANVNRISANNQLIINDIFHNMRHFGLTEANTRVAKSYVLAIIFIWIVKICAPLYIVAFTFREQERIDFVAVQANIIAAC